MKTLFFTVIYLVNILFENVDDPIRPESESESKNLTDLFVRKIALKSHYTKYATDLMLDLVLIMLKPVLQIINVDRLLQISSMS